MTAVPTLDQPMFPNLDITWSSSRALICKFFIWILFAYASNEISVRQTLWKQRTKWEWLKLFYYFTTNLKNNKCTQSSPFRFWLPFAYKFCLFKVSSSRLLIEKTAFGSPNFVLISSKISASANLSSPCPRNAGPIRRAWVVQHRS